MNEQVVNKGVDNPGKPLTLIFCIVMWERFGFYGMQALMVVFMVTKLNFDDTQATLTWGAFTALVYAFLSIGGFIGDKVLGTKRTMLFGAIVLTVGYALLAYNPDVTLYYAMGTIIAGNMMFKANPSSLVSKLYNPDDHRIDSAFTMYYMSINVSSFISMILCPLVQYRWGYSPAFLICVAGLILTIAAYLIFGRVLSGIGSDPDSKPISYKNLLYIIIGIIVMVLMCATLLKHLVIANVLLTLALIATFGILIKFIIFAKDRRERTNFIVCFVLIVEAIVFFVLYQQMPTSINLFTIRNTDHNLLGLTINPLTYQSLNPFWIMIGSPLLAIVYNILGKKGKDFAIPTKFAFGMLLCSLGFLALPFAAKFFVNETHLISGNWMIVTYGFESMGELFISGLGLAMVTKLVPQKVMGFMMGAWFMASAVAMALGGFVATFASVPKGDLGDTALSLSLYSGLFLKLGVATFVICIIMFLFAPKLKKIMNE